MRIDLELWSFLWIKNGHSLRSRLRRIFLQIFLNLVYHFSKKKCRSIWNGGCKTLRTLFMANDIFLQLQSIKSILGHKFTSVTAYKHVSVKYLIFLFFEANQYVPRCMCSYVDWKFYARMYYFWHAALHSKTEF